MSLIGDPTVNDKFDPLDEVLNQPSDPRWTVKSLDAPSKLLLQVPELVERILIGQNLSDFMQLAQLSRDMRRAIKTLFGSRVERLIIKYFFVPDTSGELLLGPLTETLRIQKTVERFWDMLDETRSGINGSVASYTIRRVDAPAWLPNNFNLIIPSRTLPFWDAFIRLCGDPVVTALQLDDAQRPCATDVVSYTLNEGYPIIIVEAFRASVIDVLICGRNTSQFRLVTRHLVFVFYMKLAADSASLEAWSMSTPEDSDKLEDQEDRKSISTASWRVKCDWACPILWRKVNNLDGVGQFCFGRDGATLHPDYTNSAFQWRLGDQCPNTVCENWTANYLPFRFTCRSS
ncbi:hypothetical protein B0H11DRAFT_2231165 [Mycena galericulata]|nr:hypothetical protein B0H11DRAFT_2231165 [Mycena galericulata]